jgi:hypothetical protein
VLGRIRRRLRRLPRLRRLLRNSGEPFHRHRSSLAEGEHTIVFVSSFPFRFAVPVRVWRSFPSNPSFLFFPVSLFRSTAIEVFPSSLLAHARAHTGPLQRTPECQPCTPPKPTPRHLAPSEGRAAGARAACRRRCLPAAGRDSATSARSYRW